MKRLGLAALFLGLASVPALCASYDDLNAGIVFWGRQEWDAAIVRFDKAIAAGDLIPSLMWVAYLDRGYAHSGKGQHDKAIADFTAAIALAPGNPEALTARGFEHLDAGHAEEALADLKTAQAKKPKDAVMEYRIGLVSWQLGRFDQADAAFDKMQRMFRYGWLWLQLTHIKLGKPVDDKPFGTQWGSGWPDPILRFYHGNIDEADVLKDAKDDPKQVCEANFYLGMWRSVRGDSAGGKPMLQKAFDNCPEDYVEKRMARFEMARKP